MLKQNLKKKIFLIGHKSFLQENLYKYLKKKHYVKKLRFTQVNKFKFSNYDTIINFSNSKSFFKKKYNTNSDRNLKIAKQIKKTNSNLVIISSRQVYKPQMDITEKSKINPVNIYSKNCIMSEKNCIKIIKNNLLILRVSNVIGFEIGKKKRPSLTSTIINSIKKKKIIFDNNYYLYKDLLPINYFCIYIEKLLKLNIKGIVNLGSGIPIKINFFLNKIIDTKKIKVEIDLKKNFTDNDFCFNTGYLYKLTKIKIKKKNLLDYFKKLNIKKNGAI